ncbi:MAG: PQQ-binding-like beta-propeller repeat protein [Verrucomicrobiota bacterium]
MKSGFRFLPALVAGGLYLSAPTMMPAEWPRFLGPAANNISGETGLREGWPEAGPKIVWSREVGNGYSAPSVRGQTLVLHHRVQQEELVEAMEAATGKMLWRHTNVSRYADPYGYNNGPRCTPLLTTNRCFTFGAEGRLQCLDLADGRSLWERETGRDWTVPPPFFGVGSTPFLEGDRLFVMVGGMPNAGVVALDAATGRTLWESVGEKTWQGKPKTGWRDEPLVNWAAEDKQASYSSPVMATIHGQRHLLCLMRQGLVSLNPDSGAVHFAFWFRTPVTESVNAVTPVVQGDLIFITSAYYRLGSALLRVKPDGQSVETVWRGLALEAHWNTPVLHEGYLYAFSGRNEPDARFRCVELKTGKVMWDRDERWAKSLGKQPPMFGRGSAILADGKLIVLGEGGLLGLFKVSSQAAEPIARWQVPELHYPIWAGPVLANKKLYLRGEDRLLCVDMAK